MCRNREFSDLRLFSCVVYSTFLPLADFGIVGFIFAVKYAAVDRESCHTKTRERARHNQLP